MLWTNETITDIDTIKLGSLNKVSGMILLNQY